MFLVGFRYGFKHFLRQKWQHEHKAFSRRCCNFDSNVGSVVEGVSNLSYLIRQLSDLFRVKHLSSFGPK